MGFHFPFNCGSLPETYFTLQDLFASPMTLGHNYLYKSVSGPSHSYLDPPPTSASSLSPTLMPSPSPNNFYLVSMETDSRCFFPTSVSALPPLTFRLSPSEHNAWKRFNFFSAFHFHPSLAAASVAAEKTSLLECGHACGDGGVG